jgi:hypothetical protein
MSLSIFIALCIVGVDFLIYVLFQWTFGDKRRAMERKLAAQRAAMKEEGRGPVLVSSRKPGAETQARLRKVQERMAKGKSREIRTHGTYRERLA